MSKSAYGTPAVDTEFRKTRDLDEYAAKAKVREAAERDEAKARYEARLAGKRYYKPLDGSESLTTARTATLDLSAQVGKVQIVPAGAGVGRRGRGAGFYCAACDWTVKDNLQWVEHINSVSHQRNVGQSGEVARSSREDVLARIEAVWARVQADRQLEATAVDVAARLDQHREEDAREREQRRAKKRDLAERRRAAKQAEAAAADTSQATATAVYGEDVRIEGEHDEDDMRAMMGFTGFGTTKKK